LPPAIMNSRYDRFPPRYHISSHSPRLRRGTRRSWSIQRRPLANGYRKRDRIVYEKTILSRFIFPPCASLQARRWRRVVAYLLARRASEGLAWGLSEDVCFHPTHARFLNPGGLARSWADTFLAMVQVRNQHRSNEWNIVTKGPHAESCRIPGYAACCLLQAASGGASR